MKTAMAPTAKRAGIESDMINLPYPHETTIDCMSGNDYFQAFFVIKKNCNNINPFTPLSALGDNFGLRIRFQDGHLERSRQIYADVLHLPPQ